MAFQGVALVPKLQDCELLEKLLLAALLWAALLLVAVLLAALLLLVMVVRLPAQLDVPIEVLDQVREDEHDPQADLMLVLV